MAQARIYTGNSYSLLSSCCCCCCCCFSSCSATTRMWPVGSGIGEHRIGQAGRIIGRRHSCECARGGTDSTAWLAGQSTRCTRCCPPLQHHTHTPISTQPLRRSTHSPESTSSVHSHHSSPVAHILPRSASSAARDPPFVSTATTALHVAAARAARPTTARLAHAA